MNIQEDGKSQIYVDWQQGNQGAKRAWIRHADPDTDWAGTGRYVNVVRIEALGTGPAGQSTDFPIFNKLPDSQVLTLLLPLFVASPAAQYRSPRDDFERCLTGVPAAGFDAAIYRQHARKVFN